MTFHAAKKLNWLLLLDINERNTRYYATKTPRIAHAKFSRSIAITVWWAVSIKGIIVRLKEESLNFTVNGSHYLHMLDKSLIPALCNKWVFLLRIWFQQDATTPHIGTEVLNLLPRSLDPMALNLFTVGPFEEQGVFKEAKKSRAP